uniref:redoxin domain-containing protein n=1 Tax=Pedobacter schmidteae TaxID=2201271 RepID=UPI000EABEEAB|nr:redoxin domain-containing protein [Pedobacter schmidteae]
MKQHLIILLLVCATTFQLRAQDDDMLPQIGKPCPDFMLKDLKNYPKKIVSLKDFAGKWLVLDFWTAGCASCIASFPKLNELQKQYQDKVQFILVGKDDRHIRPLYSSIVKRYQLQLAAAFDTVIFKQFDIGAVPHLIIVDPQGVVRAVTLNITKAHLDDFINGKNPQLPVTYGIKQSAMAKKQQVKRDIPLLIQGNGGNDSAFVYRSVLLPWKRSMGQMIAFHFTNDLIHNNRYRTVGSNLEMLYQMAYGDTVSTEPYMVHNNYGKFARKSVLEIADSSAFDHDWATGEGVYAYELILNKNFKRSTDDFRRMMRNDLENYFQFEVKVENRMMPYWRLEANKDAVSRLKTKGGKSVTDYKKDRVDLVNTPVSGLINAIWYADPYGPPVVDCTGINGNIDIHYNAISIDFEDIKRALLQKGLSLVKDRKIMEVVVVRDRVK